jgi:phosphoribosylformylglycinamidine synthase
VARPRFGVVQFPGTNCERETVRVLRTVVGADADLLWHGDNVALNEFDCVVLPGGFAHGDHLRAGAIARFAPIMPAVTRFAAQGGLVLGICNGFQVLLEAGLLPGAMLRNAGVHFRSAWVHCRVERTDTPFTAACRPGQVLRLPIAHGEGNYTLAQADDLAALELQRQVVFRYSDRDGRPLAEANPNGSLGNIAGVCNMAGTVCGLMPHPERASEALLGSADGRLVLESIGSWLDRSDARLTAASAAD